MVRGFSLTHSGQGSPVDVTPDSPRGTSWSNPTAQQLSNRVADLQFPLSFPLRRNAFSLQGMRVMPEARPPLWRMPNAGTSSHLHTYVQERLRLRSLWRWLLPVFVSTPAMRPAMQPFQPCRGVKSCSRHRAFNSGDMAQCGSTAPGRGMNGPCNRLAAKVDGE